MTSPIRIVLVDDQPLIRRGFAAILESEPGFEVVGEAANGAEAVDLVSDLAPDVVCMDVQMPVMDGITATRKIQAANLSASVLILTTFDDDEFLFEALYAGASGFLLKTAEAEELIAAIATLARGEALLAPEVTGRVLSRFVATPSAPSAAIGSQDAAGSRDAQASPAEQGSPDAPDAPDDRPGGKERPATSRQKELDLLTEREYEILLLVAQGYSNAAIAKELFIGAATVKTHVSNALMKIGVKDRVHAVIWAYENGLV